MKIASSGRPQLFVKPTLCARKRLSPDSPNTDRSRSAKGRLTFASSIVTSYGVVTSRPGASDARFWRYVVSAFSNRYDGIGLRSRELLTHATLTGVIGAQPDGAMESFVVSLLNECAERETSIVIAVDDFHEIASPSLIAGVTTFIAEAPPNVHVILLSRREPDIDTHRMQARGELLQVGASELAFTAGQCREFVELQLGPHRAGEEASRLFAATGGWPAGLRLAMLAPDTDFPRSITDDGDAAHDALSEFLSREVLAHQPAPIQGFLTATSILGSLTDRVCARVVADSASDDVTLEDLSAQGIFILRDAPHSEWYRYPLPFARMLRRRLDDQRTPRQIAALHRRAARAYADEGLYAEALGHAFEARDLRYAADLLERQMPGILNHDRNAELTAYMARLPDDLIGERPHLAAAAALMLVVSGKGEDAAGLLESVGGSPRGSGRDTDDKSTVHGMAAAIRGLGAVYAGDLSRSREWAHRALGLLPFDAAAWRAVATIVAADSDFLRGRIDLARDGYSRALAMCRTHRFHFLLMIVTLRVLRAELYHGRLEQMEGLIDDFLAESRRIGFANTAHEGQIRGFHATLAVLQHRPDVAFDRALWCTESAEGHQSMLVYGMTRIRLAEAFFARGELDPMRTTLDEAAERLAARRLPIIESFLFAWRVRLEVATAERDGRDADRALELIRERGITPESPIRVLGERELFAAVRAYRASGMAVEAKRLVERLRDFCDDTRMVIAAMEARILWSLTIDETGDRASALSALATAVERLVLIGALEPILAEGAPLKRLLVALLGTPGAPSSTADLLARFDATTAGADEQRGVEPLTRRELDVLRLISEGKSNAEVGETLFVSLNTVKWHTGNLYTKLHVDGRVGAVTRARDLGLLE